MDTSLHFSPLLDGLWLWSAIGIGIAILIISIFTYKRALILRVIVFTAFILALLNPSLLQEERNYVHDVAVVVVDRSASQKMEQRTERTDMARDYVTKQIENTNAIDLRIIEAPKDGGYANRTDLFNALDQALTDVPIKRRAGVIFLSDGQIHDVPRNKDMFKNYGPVHVLLTGRKGEKDRRIEITQAPAFGLVGKNVTVKYRVEDTRNIGRTNAQVTLHLHNGEKKFYTVPIGKEQSVTLPLAHAGQNLFSLSVAHLPDEITLSNNKTAVLINGVRDRLKVLLVSGVPHSGERTWRDLLTSDPGVDLVHFTILRGPQNSLSFVPQNELALIAFPYRELFDVKLYEFDLIIFDRYQQYNILSDRYFNNIVKFVRSGGAMLVASGPAFAGNRSIYDTPLGDILPAQPSGSVIEKSYVPSITTLGHSHPVTRGLIWNNQTSTPQTKEPWGAWLRYIEIKPARGDILMNAMNAQPLLVLDRVEKGRVAQIASDHIWLWSRGYNGGGPHAELLRRIVHWLMKEPELDERALNVRVHKDTITVEKQSYGASNEILVMETPNGESKTIELTLQNDGMLRYKHRAAELGIHAFEDANGMRKFAVIGDLDPLELQNVRTSAKALEPVIKASGGATIWLTDHPQPNIHTLGDARRYGGTNWLALRRNNDFTVTGVKDTALLPGWALLLGLMSLTLFLWWREGRSG